MSRKFDSLRQANRAFDLCREWDAQHAAHPFLRGGSMLHLLGRMRRAADYLYRRVRRAEVR
jgi:hypothetical protein